jgi:hypothetical protein
VALRSDKWREGTHDKKPSQQALGLALRFSKRALEPMSQTLFPTSGTTKDRLPLIHGLTAWDARLDQIGVSEGKAGL